MQDQLYIFLDVDGVLNHHAWTLKMCEPDAEPWTEERHFDRQLDPACIARVNQLADRLGAHIVLSSTWRRMERAEAALNRNGITWVGRTDTDGPFRGHEIVRWMEAHGVEPHQIVILDDDSDMVDLMHRLVKTNHQVGFTNADVERVLRLFSK